MWGVVSMKGGVEYYCFTSFEVTPPVEGDVSAGSDAKVKHWAPRIVEGSK